MKTNSYPQKQGNKNNPSYGGGRERIYKKIGQDIAGTAVISTPNSLSFLR